MDIPLAAALVLGFFVIRRVRIPGDETWLPDFVAVPRNIECSIGRGLFSKAHYDLHHSQLRQSTSLLLTASYFLCVPAAVSTLGAEVAYPVLTLQVVGFALIFGGMLLDRILEWPNRSLHEGQGAACYPNSCSCVATSHGVWHVIALVSAACVVVAREWALAA